MEMAMARRKIWWYRTGSYDAEQRDILINHLLRYDQLSFRMGLNDLLYYNIQGCNPIDWNNKQ